MSFICDFKSFLHGGIKNNYIGNHKNGLFGHKSQTHGLVWIGLLVSVDMIQWANDINLNKNYMSFCPEMIFSYKCFLSKIKVCLLL
jgi:hypothetical protein